MAPLQVTQRPSLARPSANLAPPAHRPSSACPLRRRATVNKRLPSSPTAPSQRRYFLRRAPALRSDIQGQVFLRTSALREISRRRQVTSSACLSTPSPRGGWRRPQAPSPSAVSALRSLAKGHRPLSGSWGHAAPQSRGAVAVRAGGRDFESRRSRGWGGDESEGEVSTELQKMLVEQVRLQIGQTQVGQVVDESQQHLRKAVREDMGQELDRIALRAMRGADEFSNRVLKQLDASAQAIERDLNLARKEMEERERDFEKFQRKVHQSSNEGMFFKSISTPYSPSAPARGRARRTRITRISPSATSSPGRSMSVSPPGAAAGPLGPSASPFLDEADISVEEARVFRKVLYFGISLTCVSFIWSFASALLDGHFMSSSKVVEYAAVFAGFVVIKAGFEASAEEERQQAQMALGSEETVTEGEAQRRTRERSGDVDE